MSPVDWDHVRRAKDVQRASSAAQSFAEKLRVLDRLRERDTDLRQARERFQNANKNARQSSLQTNTSTQAPSGHIRLTSAGANASLVATAAPTSTTAKTRANGG